VSIPELEKRLLIAEGKIDKLEQMLLDNIGLINFLHAKYSKFIPKYKGIIRGIETSKRIKELNRR
tara:strand:+ start:309 stop:503 length:195 start_codon:yes stop_codon:yes gene_type:complete